MAQLFGQQKNFESPPTISDRARENDFLGTNFLAFSDHQKQSLDNFKKAEGWKRITERMQATRDLQAFTTQSFNAPIRESKFQIDNFFDKPGHYKFMYGSANDGLANPVAAGVDYNMDYGGFRRHTENQLASYVKKDSTFENQFNKAKAKEWEHGGYPKEISPMFAHRGAHTQQKLVEKVEYAQGRKDFNQYKNPMLVSEHNVARSNFSLPVPDPNDPYMSYGLRESSDWVKREKTMVFNMDSQTKCSGSEVDGDCIPTNPTSCQGEGRVFIPDVGCVEKREKNQGVCLPGWTMKNGKCYAGQAVAF